jgi:excisionase family DNA binding protein
MSNTHATATPTATPHVAGGIVPELLTERQAAELLGIGARTLWRWSRSGVCPAPRKLGLGPRAAVRFSRSELLQWIEAGCPKVHGGQRG